ncbi:glycosyltransferase family 2 protein [Lutibacter sp. B2]|nr:glycosyltransferase family 2 protein [Lutibacter sp. B2]
MSNKGISIITCTNKPDYINNIFENYKNQDYEEKELIIILNSDNLDISFWRQKGMDYENVKIFRQLEKITLGECLNFGVKKSNFDIIAKFDDDDYYAPEYLSESIKGFDYADVIGKLSTYVYFEKSSTLSIRNRNANNQYVDKVNGPTIMFNKKIFDKVKFPNTSIAEDFKFCNACTKRKIKIYSTDISNYVYIRHKFKEKHTWRIEDNFLIMKYLVIGNIDDYKSYVINKNTFL